MLRAFSLALLAHGVLLALLASGVQWKRDAPMVTVEAELWSSVPQQAAEPAPEPAVPPEPTPQPQPPVAAPVAPPVPAAVEPAPDPAIAIAKEKVRVQREKKLQQELDEKQRREQLRAEQEKQKLEAIKTKRLQEEKDIREKLARDKAAALKKPNARSEQELREAANAKKMDELRKQNIQRMTGLAAGTGAAGSNGTQAQSSGPSAGYAGRIRARIKPNITYTETITGNPSAEVEVRTAPEGTIISRKLIQSSGVKSWDEAVLSAIDKTEVLPRDTDGRVPSSLILVFRPRD